MHISARSYFHTSYPIPMWQVAMCKRQIGRQRENRQVDTLKDRYVDTLKDRQVDTLKERQMEAVERQIGRFIERQIDGGR